MWECSWRKEVKSNKQLRSWTESRLPGLFSKNRWKKTLDFLDLLQAIDQGHFFGMVQCDVHVPDYLKEHFSEMCPLFLTCETPVSAIGDYMKNYAAQHNIPLKPKRQLVAGLKAEKVLLITPLLNWYLDHGLVVTKVYQAIEFCPQRPFKEFTNMITSARENASRDPNLESLARKLKLIGNCAFGSLIMDSSKFRNTRYAENIRDAKVLANRNLFRRLEDISSSQDQHLYEVIMAKPCIRHYMPKQLGFFVLQYAKLRILQFYYDFIDVFVDRSQYELCNINTDALCFAISGETLQDVVKPEMLDSYKQMLFGNCSDTWKPDTSKHFLLRQCCPKHTAKDKVTPGLFKLEWHGDVIRGLCSNTYCVTDMQNNIIKLACSGQNKSSVESTVFKQVLDTKLKASATTKKLS